MSSNSDDIQAVGSDTRPPMLDEDGYESWSQRNRLYLLGERKMDANSSAIDQGPLSLEPQRDAHWNYPRLEETFYLDSKVLVHRGPQCHGKKLIRCRCSEQPTFCTRTSPKKSTSTSITTLKQKQFGDNLPKASLACSNSQKKI
ncbi:hypothetical protein Tco_1561885 [Tanacetum coccineum]